MDELLKLLKIHCGPATDGKEFIKVTCGVDFEPHGIASEDWEIYWTLLLPEVPFHYWRNDIGWTKGTAERGMSFSGRTFDAVIKQAIAFMKAVTL